MDAATHDPAYGTGELQSIEMRNPGTIPARSARFQLARWKLQQGLGFIAADDPVRALPLLKDARKSYGELVRDCVDVPLLAQEALMGRATAEESLVGIHEPSEAGDNPEQPKEEKYAGSLASALDFYRELARKYPEGILALQAEKRAHELEQQTAKIEQFYVEANKKPALKSGAADLESKLKNLKSGFMGEQANPFGPSLEP